MLANIESQEFCALIRCFYAQSNLWGTAVTDAVQWIACMECSPASAPVKATMSQQSACSMQVTSYFLNEITVLLLRVFYLGFFAATLLLEGLTGDISHALCIANFPKFANCYEGNTSAELACTGHLS